MTNQPKAVFAAEDSRIERFCDQSAFFSEFLSLNCSINFHVSHRESVYPIVNIACWKSKLFLWCKSSFESSTFRKTFSTCFCIDEQPRKASTNENSSSLAISEDHFYFLWFGLLKMLFSSIRSKLYTRKASQKLIIWHSNQIFVPIVKILLTMLVYLISFLLWLNSVYNF